MTNNHQDHQEHQGSLRIFVIRSLLSKGSVAGARRQALAAIDRRPGVNVMAVRTDEVVEALRHPVGGGTVGEAREGGRIREGDDRHHPRGRAGAIDERIDRDHPRFGEEQPPSRGRKPRFEGRQLSRLDLVRLDQETPLAGRRRRREIDVRDAARRLGGSARWAAPPFLRLLKYATKSPSCARSCRDTRAWRSGRRR